MKANHFGKLKKENGNLIPANKADIILFNKFKESIPEGTIVEVFMEEIHEDGNLAQLALCHVLLKQLAIDSGNSVADLKLFVKDKVGLCMNRTIKGKEFIVCKSLGNCSSQELSLFIQGCLDLQANNL